MKDFAGAQHARNGERARNCAEGDTVCLICGSTSHSSNACPSEAAEELRKGRHTSRAQVHSKPAWPFGDGYVSQLGHLYGKQDGRGQHNVGKADTSKYAPKNPKAGAPLPGHRAPKGSR